MVADNTNKQVPQEGEKPRPSTVEQSRNDAQTQATEAFRKELSGGTDDKKDSKLPGDHVSDAPGEEKTPEQQMLDEVYGKPDEGKSTAAKVVDAAAKMVGLPPGLLEAFGDLTLDDPAAAEGKAKEVASKAKTEAATDKTTDKPATKPGESSSWGDWAADTFNTYVSEPISAAMNDVTTAFDETMDWFGNTFTSAKGDLAQVNNKTDEYRKAENSEARNNRFDLKNATDRNAEVLKLPEGAEKAGTIEIGGNKVSVMKTYEADGKTVKDTYLQNADGKVIGKMGKDGSYNLALQDGSNLDFKLSEKDGKYNIDRLERSKDGKLQQKISDGVFYNYNYDAQGNPTSVDAAADLKGPLSPEKMEAIRKELGDNGAAALRVTDKDNNTQRLLLQTHGKDTTSLTDIDKRRAQIFHNGQEYRLNEKDQIGMVDKNGDWQAPPDSPETSTPDSQDPESQEQTPESKERQEEIERRKEEIRAEQKRLQDLARRVRDRAQGTSDEAVDGVKLKTETNPDGTTGDATITREDPTTGKPQTTTEIPKSAEKPIEITNSNGEKAQVRDGNFDLKTASGEKLFEFDKESGLKTNDLQADKDGLKDPETGEGLLDSNGNFIGSGEVEEDCGLLYSEELEEIETDRVADSLGERLKSFGHQVTAALNSDPAAALRLGTAAISIGQSALANVGNDLMSQITITHQLGNIRQQVASAGSAVARGSSTTALNPLSSLDQDRFRSVA